MHFLILTYICETLRIYNFCALKYLLWYQLIITANLICIRFYNFLGNCKSSDWNVNKKPIWTGYRPKKNGEQQISDKLLLD